MKRMIFIVAVFLSSGALEAEADADVIEKYRKYLPSEIIGLSTEERSSSVPIKFIQAANLAASNFGKLLIQKNLNILMYDGFADYEGAKKAFQTDLGEGPTGELTVGQIASLDYRAKRINMTPVSFFSSEYGGAIYDNWAFVKGTSKIVDEKNAYPINHVEIKCNRLSGTCEYKQIILDLPGENSWAQSYHVGNIVDETYRITRWENKQIDAVPTRTTACRINQLGLNFETNEYYEIARNNTSGNCETLLGASLPKLEKPRISQIVDGQKIIDAEFQSIGDEAYTYLSSRFRERVNSLRNQ